MLKLKKKDNTPVYLQIYQQLRDQIISGELAPGERLKATRTLAEEYHLSRNTVLYAYQQLESEGFVRSIIGSGFYVEDLPEYRIRKTTEPSLPQREERKESCNCDFRYGTMEPNIYRNRAFRRCFREALDIMETEESLSSGDPEGSFGLRQAICEHLLEQRGVSASADRILITSGHHYSISLLQKLLPQDIRTLLIEEPGHRDSRDIFRDAGYRICPIALDENGMRTDELSGNRRSLTYVTPSHQFPMGMILPIGRRLQLLAWAQESDSYIIEDDYDSELRYREQPVDALFSLDRNQRVIYLGSFSKSLSPDLRVSYIVLPESLRPDVLSRFLPASSASQVIQLTLENYLKSGEYRKQIARMRNILRKKHTLIIDSLREHCSDSIGISGIGGGTHFVLKLPTERSQEEIIGFFRERDIAVYPTEEFFFRKQGSDPSMILIGYSGIPLKKLPECMERFLKAFDELIQTERKTD